MTLHPCLRFTLAACLFLSLTPSLPAATDSNTLPLVAKWGRFEQSFTSAIAYTNHLPAATLTATFTSPLGESNPLFGFLVGNKIWRIRVWLLHPDKFTF